jgi:hypothetical protein
MFMAAVNLLGVGLLLGALSERFADALLRRWTWILPPDTPYCHSEYGRIWLWWAIIGAGFFAALNLIAAGWPPAYARTIVWLDVACYLAFEALAIAAMFSPRRWGAGMKVAHVLWLGQAGWGVGAAL